MHVGADVLEGFGPNAAQKSKTNIFAHGYADGSRVSFGASRKGRIWSHRAANDIFEWVRWARTVGTIVTDESIDIASVMRGFIIPKAATERPPLVPLGIEWPWELIANTSETRLVDCGGEAYPLLDLDLTITSPTADGPIRFTVASDSWTTEYEMTFDEDGPKVAASSGDCTISLTRGLKLLAQFITEVGMTVFFEQEAVLSPDGYLMQPDRSRPRFAPDELEAVDWTGINIRKESQGENRDPDSVQFRAIELLSAEEDWEVVLNDDGSGELADVAFLRREDNTLHALMVHCKYSSEDAPGARLGDLYEVCGQATKSYKARADIELILRKLLRRERKRQGDGKNRFVRGDMGTLVSILKGARFLDAQVTVVIVQPGLSKAKFTNPLSELIGCTQLYLSETYNSRLRVLCSA